MPSRRTCGHDARISAYDGPLARSLRALGQVGIGRGSIARRDGLRRARRSGSPFHRELDCPNLQVSMRASGRHGGDLVKELGA